MALATLYNIPSDDNEMNIFSFTNQDEHNKIAQAIYAKYSISVPFYVIDPMPLHDMGTWLEQHQILHNYMNGVTNGNSNDLTSVDFTDEDQLTEWIWLHAQEHYFAAGVLGID
jgi:hypothetical protein